MSHDPIAPRTPSSRATLARARLAVAATLALGLALVIYRPWHAVPFDIRDFSEFLPLLRGHPSFGGRMHAFAGYYASQGRLNLLSYLLIIGRWAAFGWHSAAWRTARFVEMCAVVAGAFVILRRFGAGRVGAAAGAALFIVASPAVQGWTRLTVGEPLGVLALLAMLHVAIGYRSSAHWRRDAATIALVLVATLLVKEMFVLVAPFVFAVALCVDAPGRVARPVWSPRIAWLAGAMAAAALVVLVPVAIIAMHASRAAYASQYGATSPGAGRVLSILLTFLLPVHPQLAPRVRPLVFPGNWIFLLLVILGWRVALRGRGDGGDRAPVAILGALALSLPVVAAAVYSPWPTVEDFYGLPALLGAALLVALAVTHVERRAPRRAWLAYAACLVMLAYATMTAEHVARSIDARQTVNAGLAESIASSDGRDSVVVAMRYLTAQRWQGTGPTLGRYARALHPDARVPAVTDALCAATDPLYSALHAPTPPRSVLVTFADQCGTFPDPSRTVREYYRYVFWPTLEVRTDSVRGDVLGD